MNPQQYSMPPQQPFVPPKKKHKKTPWLIAIGALAVIGIATGATHSGTPTAAPVASTAPAYPVIATVDAPAQVFTTTEAPAPKLDPLSTDGMWLIGKDIPAGTYQVTPKSSIAGYWALCSDLSCDIGEGMIKNDLVDGPSYVVIPADAKAIKLQRVTLTPAN
jgi:hypothetical protein